MKVLSYNVYGVKETKYPTPIWEERQNNLYINLSNILKDEDIKVLCFQEVNEYNMELITKIINENNFICLEKFPMITESVYQYNIVAVKNDIKVNNVYCLPHGMDTEYKNVNNQVIDYDMSDYRTTVFVEFNYSNKKYLIGNTHTDYISTEGKIKGIVKSLNYMDNIDADYKFVVGDMNMVSHMSEVYNILKQNSNYITLSRSRNFDITDNSWQGYGTMEQVNVDFAFIEKDKKDLYDYKIIKQQDMMKEGSDHRPIMIDIG
mgnify:CR=1 FL=1